MCQLILNFPIKSDWYHVFYYKWKLLCMNWISPRFSWIWFNPFSLKLYLSGLFWFSWYSENLDASSYWAEKQAKSHDVFFFFYKAVFNNVHSLSCIFLSFYPLRSTIQYPLLFIISLLCHRWYLRDEKWEKKCYENYLFQFYSPQYIFQFYCSAVSVPEGGHFKAGQVHLPSAVVPS